MSAKRLAFCIALLALISANGMPVSAKKQNAAPVADSSILTNTLAGPFQGMQGMDPIMATLLWQLSHKPELMNLDYLRYYIGNPDGQQIGARSHAYYWYDRMRQPKYELYQEDDKPGQVVESQMVVHVPPCEDLEIEALEDTLGPPVRSYFDHDGSPTQMFCFVPNTSMAMHSPPNTYRITKSTITYIGAPLPSPSFEDIQVAHDSFVGRSDQALASASKASPTEALEFARERVKEHPADANAHIALAQALKRNGSVYQAINEYKQAMALNKFNDGVQQQCIQGLKDLHVLPQDYGIDQATGVAAKRKLEFSHSGQRMRVADTVSPTTY